MKTLPEYSVDNTVQVRRGKYRRDNYYLYHCGSRSVTDKRYEVSTYLQDNTAAPTLLIEYIMDQMEGDNPSIASVTFHALTQPTVGTCRYCSEQITYNKNEDVWFSNRTTQPFTCFFGEDLEHEPRTEES